MRKNLWISFFISSIILLSTGCSDNDNDNNKNNDNEHDQTWINNVDQFFCTMEENNEAMGSITITKDGTQIYSKSTGYLDVENKIKSQSDTKYRIGSVSKTFTAVLVFMAMEEKELALDQTLDHYYPSVANSSKITIAQLLRHESGLSNYTEDPIFEDSYQLAKTREEMIQIISGYGSIFEPGSHISYSNTNYLLLTYILEEIYNSTYGDILNEKIIRPQQLINTCMDKTGEIIQKRSFSYLYEGTWIKQDEINASLLLGAGGILSTPSDMCKFINALFSYKIISKSSLDIMTTLKGDERMGMGIAEIPFNNERHVFLGHGGSVDAFRSGYLYNSSDKVCIAYSMNGIPEEDEEFSVNNFIIEKLTSIYE